MDPNLYTDTFAPARSPPLVFTAVSTRLGVQRALTADLAAFLHERALVEEHYIRSLEKLGARIHSQQKDALFREQAQLALSQRDQDRTLGQAWATLRRTIESDLAETARVHDRWRTKVDKEVAQPLRDSLAKGDWARWNQQEQNLAAQVKEYDQLVDKVQKAQQKSTKSGKSASSKQLQSQSALASLGSSLTSALPAFLRQSQQLDLAHGALVKEHLVLCGTHTSDLGRDRMEAGERLLNQVLAVDEGAEAQEWALREGQRLGGAGGQVGSQLATVGEFGEAPSGVNGAGGRADSLLDRDDAASTVSGATGVSRSRTTSRPNASSAGPPPAVPLPLPTAADADSRSVRSSSNSKPTSKLGSKFSAILGGGSSSSSSSKRDRSSSIPNSAKYANFANSGASDAPPVPSMRDQQQPSFDRRETDASSLSGNGGDLLGGRSGAGSLAPPLQPESRDKRKSLMPGSGSSGGGGLFRRASRANTLQDDEGAAGQYQQQQQAQYASGPMSAEPLGGAGAGAGGGASGAAPRVDSEGYSLPPDGYDRAIGASGAGTGATGASRNLMDEDDEDEMPLGNSVPKLSIAPSPLPPSSPTMPQEDEQARLAALESVKSALGAPAGGLGRRTTTNRGRRGTDPALSGSASSAASSAQRNTLYAPGERQDSTLSSVSATSEDDTPLAQVAEKHRRAPPPPPAARATSPNGARPVSAFIASPTTGGESPFGGSSSMSVSAANAVVAPPLASPTGSSSGFVSPGAFSPTAAPGRTMSVLSATSSLGGASALGSSAPLGGASSRPDPFAGSTAPGLRASVTESVSALLKGGEVTRALVTGEVALSHRSTGEEVKLRVTGLEGAEKVAPNATFLHASSAAGEYALSPSFATTTGGSTTPVLKYALSASASSVVPPLSVKPTWRVEPGLARAIVAYAPLASSPLVAQVDDVRVELHLASGTISSFQAKPQAQMLPSGKGIVFTLPAGAANTEGKLLASLVTVADGGAPAQPGNVAVHWVVRGATAGRVGVERVEGGELDEVRRETTSGKYLAA
ncbi:hypothetical protein JCM8208_007341 [Rhodotorula glutinis]